VIKLQQLFDQAALQLENVLCKYVHFFIKVVDCYNINKLLYIKLYFVIVFFCEYVFANMSTDNGHQHIHWLVQSNQQPVPRWLLLHTTQPKTCNRKASSTSSTCISILVDNSLRCIFTILNTILC